MHTALEQETLGRETALLSRLLRKNVNQHRRTLSFMRLLEVCSPTSRHGNIQHAVCGLLALPSSTTAGPVPDNSRALHLSSLGSNVLQRLKPKHCALQVHRLLTLLEKVRAADVVRELGQLFLFRSYDR